MFSIKSNFRVISVVVILAILLSLVNIGPALAAAYTVTDLGTLGGSYSYPQAINEAGQIAGWAYTAASQQHAFVWEGGVMTDLGTLGGSYSSAQAINEAGQILGSAATAGGQQHAFVWQSGVMTDLGTLGGNSSYPVAINEAGQVIGASNLAGDAQQHAFLWQGGVMTDLGTFGGSYSYPVAINEAGQVIGYASTPGNSSYHAFLWQAGVMTDLGTLGGSYSFPHAINEAGQIIGYADAAGGEQHAFFWQGGVMTDLGTLGGTYSSAQAINEAGQVIGYASTPGDSNYHAFMWQGGVMTDLGTLGGSYSYPQAINEAGQVIGYSTTAGDSQQHAFVWQGGVMTDLGTFGGSYSYPQAINEAGQVIGYAYTAGNAGYHAFVWEGGVMTDLGTFGGSYSFAQAINEAGQIIGYAFLAGDSNYHAFLATTMSVNLPPTASAGGPYSGDEGSAIALSGASASDPDADVLIYLWSVNSALCSFNDTSLLNPNLTCTDNGNFTATLSVDDGNNPPVTSDASVTVNNVAPSVDVPVVSPEPSAEGQSVTASATFGDPGSNDDPFTCTVNYGDGSGDLPGMVLGNTCTEPSHPYSIFGNYNVTVNVTDKDGDTGSNSVSHLVEDITAPSVISSLRANANPTSAASVDFVVTFSESVGGVDTGDFALTTTGVAGTSVTGLSGSGATYTVTVDTGSGDGTIRLDVLDDGSIVDDAGNQLDSGFSGGETYDVDKNDAPVFTSSAVTTVDEDALYLYNVTTGDLDAGDTLTISAPILPAWLTLTDNGDRTAVLTGTPTNSEVGIHNVTLRVSDGTVYLDQVFTIDVGNTNDGPSFTSSAITAATEDSIYSYSITTSDPDVGASLTISATTLPAWLSLVDHGDGTASLSGTPTNAEVGDHAVVLQVSDGIELATQSFTVTVANTNDAPTDLSLSASSVDENQPIGTTVGTFTTTDPDVGDTSFTYTLVSGAGDTDNASFSISGDQLRTAASFNFELKSSYDIRVQSSDGNGGNFEEAFTVTVNDLDEVNPVVLSSTRVNPSPTDLASVGFTVTFSESVTGVDASDFTLTTTGVSGAAVSGVSGSGSIYIVTVSTGTGNGTIRLNVTDNDSIMDGAANRLGGTGAGNGDFNTGQTYTINKTLTYSSLAAKDGWVLESSEHSNVGGSSDDDSSTLRVGDDSRNKQYRSLLHFDTSTLPDTAVITSVTLRIKRQGLTGTNPFVTHGGLLVDIKKPYFGLSIGLTKGDFQAVPGQSAVGTFGATPVGDWYSAILGSTSYAEVNLSGSTQFRLRFTLDDNHDHGADYKKFYSGNASASNRPQLIITYYVP